ncbi:ATP-dependent RNA helicase SUPV3L1/SUV3 [Novimethylophilus kurashikiensis]|uniref:ATP-dependent RNA helicase SUPV3L1/SUV3 n=1 Tax=Novimethylophilus kurashikiensis TaxID=1825523 RepID=A0A2R5FCU6_9PROT|nr:helicase-related protein [Novimethylophilus kurashikiensis]GBG14531.1 ATP-dependent RNA helicase SUPV3L1/SUV3 [Novimethylophilus kurashikiensis]
MDAIAVPAPDIRVTRLLSGNKMWLVAGKEVLSSAGDIKIRGYIDETCLGPQTHWKHLTPEQRDAAERSVLESYGEKLLAAVTAASEEIASFLEACFRENLEPKLKKLRDSWASGTLNLAKIGQSLMRSLEDMRSNQRHRQLADQIGQNIKLSDFPDIFPARSRQRKLIAVLGPTNSGKTYDAFKRLATAGSGAYLGPLRLLALEAFTRLNEEFGVTASLITGEERRIVEGSRITASTIEMLDPSKVYDCVVIDEIQMLNDPSRGWAWTHAVVSANASEIWLLGALSAEPAIKALAERLGLPLEIHKKSRKHPLEVSPRALAAHPMTALRQARAGDAFIVFSRRDALNLRDDLLALKKSVACIYGALSPEVREREARRFASGEADILVATDAVGMGLNLPIQRVVFTSVQKFDGEAVADLPVALAQQIGGRAGRYGHQTEMPGEVVGLTAMEHSVVETLMAAKQLPLPTRGFQITATSSYLETVAALTGDDRLEALLSLLQRHADTGDGFFTLMIPEEQLTRAAYLDKLPNMALALKYTFSMTPISSREEKMEQVWAEWARRANQGLLIPVDFITTKPERASLGDAETVVRLLAAYRWMGYRLPNLFIDYEETEQLLATWTTVVDEHLRSRRKQGAGGGKPGLPSWYWQYRKNR